MRPTTLLRIAVPVVFVLAQAAALWAGQVVTSDVREWAKKALAEEKTAASVTATNTVAVLYFLNRTGQRDLDPLEKGFALMLITDLSAVNNLQVVERVKLQAVAEEMGLGASGLVEPASAPRTGRLLRAQWLVGGEYTGDPAKLRVQSRVLDVPRERILGQPASQSRIEELYRIEKEVLFGIVKLLKITVTPEEQLRLRKPCSTDSKALFYLFKGVEASDRGEYESAADLYEQALDEDPNICVAREALDELEDLGLLAAKKGSSELLQSLRDTTSLTNQLTPKDELRYVLTPKDVPTTTTIQVIFPTPGL